MTNQTVDQFRASQQPTMAEPIISADSHITEPPDTYAARIDQRFKDRAPHVVRDPKRGDLFVIEELASRFPWDWSQRPASAR